MDQHYVTNEQWLAKALMDDTKGGPASSLVLVHVVGEQEKELQNTIFGAKAWTAAEVAKMIDGIAREFCQDFAGDHTFLLKVFYNKRGTPEAFHPFRVVSKGKAGSGLFTDEATDKGQLKQKMSQERDLHSALLTGLNCMNENTLKLIQMQGTMLERSYVREAQLVQENREAFDIVKDSLMKQALNTHDMKMKELAFQRSTEFRKKLMTALPVVVNQLFGKEVFPQSMSDTALVEMIAEGIKVEDVGKLMEILPAEFQGVLFTRFQAHTKKKNDEAEETAKLLRETNPEHDAAGGNP